MKKTILFLILICVVPTSTFADTFFGVYVGAGYWNQETSGDLRYKGSDVSLQNELGLDRKGNGSVYIAIEHPVPSLPNIKLQYTKVSTTGTSVLSESFTFDNVTYNASDTINSRFVLDNGDVILYYEVLDNWLNLDVGLDIKVFNGDIFVESTATSNNGSHSFDVPIPMLYAKAQLDIPTTGFYFGGEGSAISTGDADIYDFKLMAGYESSIGLGCEIGWRKIGISVDDADDLVADIAVDGVYANLTYHF